MHIDPLPFPYLILQNLLLWEGFRQFDVDVGWQRVVYDDVWIGIQFGPDRFTQDSTLRPIRYRPFDCKRWRVTTSEFLHLHT